MPFTAPAIHCPDCKKQLYAEREMASVAQLRRLEQQLVQIHKERGHCTGTSSDINLSNSND